ncbi:MAG: acetyl-CoA hydrolase/transferase family protein [Acidimicrobiaceae bacterium]|nr:acetyl-CoA hydrolase/transferase family protein [Acidimicrobiaceae bacterium]
MKQLDSFEELLPVIKTGSRIVMHSAAAEPLWLGEQMAQWGLDLRDLEVYMLSPMKAVPFAALAPEHLKIHAWVPGHGLRGVSGGNSVEYYRFPLSEIPGLYLSGSEIADILFLHLSLPDKYGRFSLGVSVDYMPAVLATHPLVVAEVDPNMPFTVGDTYVTEDQIDYWFSTDEGPLIVPSPSIDEGERRIAQMVADLISDGAILQTGVGSIPDAMLQELASNPPRDLGIHTGIFTDGVVELAHTGNVTNSTKPGSSHKMVTAMAWGSPELYKYLDGNDDVEFKACSYTHDRKILSAMEHLHAVNSALQIDLLGRVNAEWLKGRIISAPGGLPDFASAAHAASKGLSIIALRATSRDGLTSNITPTFSVDVPVTLAPDNVDFVVTEFGTADLRGLSSSGWAKELIKVAHPDFRSELARSIA